MHLHAFLRCILVLSLVVPIIRAATDAPTDPPWALDTAPNTGAGEVAVPGRDKVVRDAYGYFVRMNIGGSYEDPADPDWDGGVIIRLRYIPNHGSAVNVEMPQGVPPGGLFPRGAMPGEWSRHAVEEPFAIGRQGGDAMPGAGQALYLSDIETNGFWMTENEISQGTWKAISDAPAVDPEFVHEENPIERVRHSDVITWLAELQNQYQEAMEDDRVDESGNPLPTHPPLRAGETFTPRLPTEDEWEYACRAGSFSPYWAGTTLRPLQWDTVRHDETTNGHHYHGRNPTFPDDVIDRVWNTGTVAQQQTYLGKRISDPETWTYTANATKETGDPGYLVPNVHIQVEVKIMVQDYFLLEPIDLIEANFDSHYRRHWLADWPGTHVPLRERWRCLGNNDYVRDPSVRDNDVYFRYRASDPASAGPTPDDDFVRYHSNIGRFYSYSKDGNVFAHPDGLFYQDGGFHRVHCREWLSIDGQRYRPRRADPNRENPDDFEEHYTGLWVRSAIHDGAGGSVIRERFHQIDAALVQATFDPSGFFWNQTMPYTDSPLDQADAENLLDTARLGHGIVNIAGTTVTIDPNHLTSIQDDLAKIRQAVEDEWKGKVFGTGDNAHWFDGTFSVSANTTFDWKEVNSKLKNDGYTNWSGFDVRAMRLDQIIPNPWGLMHMHGNVAEWTSTPWDGISHHGNHNDGTGSFVVKGGSWRFGIDQVRSASRQTRIGDGQSPEIRRQDTSTQPIPPAVRDGYDDVGFRFIIPAFDR